MSDTTHTHPPDPASVREIAALLGVCRATAQARLIKLARAGAIRRYALSRQSVRYDRSDVLRWCEEQGRLSEKAAAE